MANIRKWMAEARACEDRGDVDGALRVFRKALVAQQESSGFADLSLHNGLGDLYLRSGLTADAVEAYESAAAQCEEQQLYANGIALCKKILRNAPDYRPVYRRAGRLFGLSGLDAEARASYAEYARRSVADGEPEGVVDALRERVEILSDDGAALELADTLAQRGQVGDALSMLRATRDRLEREGAGVVPIVRKIQELQPPPAVDPEPGRLGGSSPETAPVAVREPVAPPVRAAVAVRVAPTVPHVPPAPDAHTPPVGVPELAGGRPPREIGPRDRAARARVEAPGDPDDSPGDAATDATAIDATAIDATATDVRATDATAIDDADTEALTRELHRILSEADGEDRLRGALPLVEHLLELEPGKFELLHRKLGYAFALGDGETAVAAYLALGASLDRRFSSFSLRSLSSTTEAGSITAAVTVERSVGSVSGTGAGDG